MDSITASNGKRLENLKADGILMQQSILDQMKSHMDTWNFTAKVSKFLVIQLKRLSSLLKITREFNIKLNFNAFFNDRSKAIIRVHERGKY